VPVESADRIELAVNLKTAELLGVTVPRKIKADDLGLAERNLRPFQR
jgi:hypothetical protein